MESIVEFETLGERSSVAVARLVREKSLNSLLLETVDQLYAKISSWLLDDSVKCIILDSGSPRAFCAGADIVALYRSITGAEKDKLHYADQFFLSEYRLDYALQMKNKPIIGWGGGIVMGGGLGLLSGCSHRIGSRSTRIAMPEITIGLFPDAGGTKFLSCMPDGLGWFLGLTGSQLPVGDALALDFLDVVVEESNKHEIFKAISELDWRKDALPNAALISRTLKDYEIKKGLPTSLMDYRMEISALINRCLLSDNFFTEFEKKLPLIDSDDWMSLGIQNYQKGSPTTARIFEQQMNRADNLDWAEVFRMELSIAYHCARDTDFSEGVRALLVDKDRNPNWRFSNPGQVPDDFIKRFFESPWEEDSHPLRDLGQQR